MLYAKSSDQNWANFGGFGDLGIRVTKSFDFTRKGTCVRFSHYASKSVEGCALQVGWGKNPESHRGSHRKDMSPSTQGLNYRSACDVVICDALTFCHVPRRMRFTPKRLTGSSISKITSIVTSHRSPLNVVK